MTNAEKLLILEAESIAYRKWFDAYVRFVIDVQHLLYGPVSERLAEWLEDKSREIQITRNKYDLLLDRVPKKQDLPQGKN
jgi:hypothetical protein